MSETAHSARYEQVKRYYDTGLWDIAKIRNAVVKGWITADEYKEITGQDYTE